MTTSSAVRIPTRTNLMLAGLVVAAHAGALLGLPSAGISQIWTIVPVCVLALGTPVHWALIHEAIHGLLLPQRIANDRLARLLAICFGVPFRAARFAHLRHHRYNRTPWGREEVYDPATRPPPIAYCFHYLRITFGLYLGELALCLLCWLPQPVLRRHVKAMCPDLDDGTGGMGALAERDILSAPVLAQIRFDSLCIIALYGTAFVCYGDHWPVLAAFLSVRAFIASQLDHAPHHDTPLDRRDHALNLSAPRWLRCVLLNFNFHRTHHRHPNLPWRSLEAMSEFEAGDISFARAVLRQWRGPISLERISRRAAP